MGGKEFSGFHLKLRKVIGDIFPYFATNRQANPLVIPPLRTYKKPLKIPKEHTLETPAALFTRLFCLTFRIVMGSIFPY